MSHIKFLACIGIVALVAATSEAIADEAAAERCIPIKSIEHTKIVDDQNIVFYAATGKIYNNHLPHRCQGLASADSFKYETSQPELCSVDLITVMQYTGGSLTTGASCGLGAFTLSEAEKKADH